jgi:hypothetical protein
MALRRGLVFPLKEFDVSPATPACTLPGFAGLVMASFDLIAAAAGVALRPRRRYPVVESAFIIGMAQVATAAVGAPLNHSWGRDL